MWCFGKTILQFPCCSAFPQCFLQCFAGVCLKCYCMQCWEWIIPCYEFIQRPKGPLICIVEFLMNRSQLGPESYEVRLSSSLSSRWTVSRGLSDIQREKLTAEGKTWRSLFLRDQPRKCSKTKCAFLAFSFEQITPPKANPRHNSLQSSLQSKGNRDLLQQTQMAASHSLSIYTHSPAYNQGLWLSGCCWRSEGACGWEDDKPVDGRGLDLLPAGPSLCRKLVTIQKGINPLTAI